MFVYHIFMASPLWLGFLSLVSIRRLFSEFKFLNVCTFDYKALRFFWLNGEVMSYKNSRLYGIGFLISI